MKLIVYLLALSALLGFSSLAQAAPATSVDTSGNIQFTFNDVPSVRIAPVGNVAGGSACPPASEGAIRFNQLLKSFEGCDGTRWRSFSDFDTRQWVSMKSLRAFGIPYTNNTGQAIEVSLMTFSGCVPGVGSCPASTPYPNATPMHCAASIAINGVMASYQFANSPGETSMCNVKAVVPAGATYVGNNDGWPTNDIYLYEWAELR